MRAMRSTHAHYFEEALRVPPSRRKNGKPQKEIMRPYSTAIVAEAVLTTLLIASSAYAGEHSAPNGTWT